MTASRFRFNIRECAGAFGDLGTMLPFAVGFIAVCGVDASSLFITLGICNILCGLVFRVPVPLQPMKLIAVVAIAAPWSSAMLYACGIATGIIWTILGLTHAMTALGRITPVAVVGGIQAALAVMLAYKSFQLMQAQWLLAILSILIVVACRKSRHVPAALILLFLAAILIWLNKDTPLAMQPAFCLPSVAHIDLERTLEVMLQAGFAQIPLTAANAVIATTALARSYWPESPITEKKLSLSMGLINMAAPLTGGIPVCHGAGGLAAQYAFGARTCGAKIIEGSIMLALGLLLAGNIADLLTAFPEAVLGVMLLVPSFELLKPATALRSRTDLALLAVTLLSALLVNMAFGFLLGITWHYAQERLTKLNLEKKP